MNAAADQARYCTAQCLAESFDLDQLLPALEQGYRVVRFHDATHLESAEWEAFVFPYGTIVAWGISYDDEQRLLAILLEHATQAHATPFNDRFSFTEGAAQARIHNDHVELASVHNNEKLAISHGLAQSVKLMELEDRVRQTIEQNSHIPQNIAQYGSANLSRKAIAKLRGRLYLVRSDIHLHFDLLDTPEFFWEYPEWQELYHNISNYLEIDQRIRLLNGKLEIIQELLVMLADERNHQHSSTLEWIIIWLIAFEIVIFFIHDIFKWF